MPKQGYRITFFSQMKAMPLKQNDWEADLLNMLVCHAPTYPPKTGPTQKKILPFRDFLNKFLK